VRRGSGKKKKVLGGGRKKKKKRVGGRGDGRDLTGKNAQIRKYGYLALESGRRRGDGFREREEGRRDKRGCKISVEMAFIFGSETRFLRPEKSLHDVGGSSDGGKGYCGNCRP